MQLMYNTQNISYSSASKPTFNISSAINQPVPQIGDYSYLTLNDSDVLAPAALIPASPSVQLVLPPG